MSYLQLSGPPQNIRLGVGGAKVRIYDPEPLDPKSWAHDEWQQRQNAREQAARAAGTLKPNRVDNSLRGLADDVGQPFATLVSEYVAKSTTLRNQIQNVGATLGPTPLVQADYADLPADMKNLVGAAARFKADAEAMSAAFTVKVLAISSAAFGDPGVAWVRQNLSDATNEAEAILTKWKYFERDAKTFTDLYTQNFDNLVKPPVKGMTWEDSLKWGIGLYFAAQILGALRK